MYRKISALLAVLLLLGGCHRTSESSPSPGPLPGPGETATPSPEPLEEPTELRGFPIDETHDAFEVDTGGKLGTVLVTVERGEDELDGLYNCAFSVWDANDLTTPIQTFEQMGLIRWHTLMDANFDGYMDFCYTHYNGVANESFCLYCWDEEQRQFVLSGGAFGYGFEVDEEDRVLRNYVHYAMYAGAEEIYRWENGELVCVREVEINYPTEPGEDLIELIVRDNVDGEMTEIYREGFSEEDVVWEASYKWYDPDYSESVWGFPVDETHDAFLVPTKGELGAVLVTVERGEEEDTGEYHYTLSVWEKSDLTTPIQQLEEIGPEFGGADLVDANFDGYTDFLCLWNWMAVNWPFNLYVWDETQGRFVHKADFLGRGVHVDEAEQVIEVYVHWTNVDGVSEVYRWENGELVCFRREEYLDGDHVTRELVNGEWQEIFREPDPRLG